MRRESVRRPATRSSGRLVTLAAATTLLAGATLAAGGCARSGQSAGSGESSYEVIVAARPDSTLRIARTQLEHHNYKVSDAGRNAIVTLPALIPAHLQDKSGATKGRYWVLRVSAEPQSIGGGTRLRVAGYVLPVSSRPPGAAPPPQEAIPVTSANRALFAEVQAAGRWIKDEAWRNRKRR